MKIRTGFVSNSSSCSFVINKDCITGMQRDKIYDYYNFGVVIGHIVPDDIRPGWESSYRNWSIHETPDAIKGFSVIDNFDMPSYLDKIGINRKNIEFDE